LALLTQALQIPALENLIKLATKFSSTIIAVEIGMRVRILSPKIFAQNRDGSASLAGVIPQRQHVNGMLRRLADAHVDIKPFVMKILAATAALGPTTISYPLFLMSYIPQSVNNPEGRACFPPRLNMGPEAQDPVGALETREEVLGGDELRFGAVQDLEILYDDAFADEIYRRNQ
jgi:hypothetical protein